MLCTTGCLHVTNHTKLPDHSVLGYRHYHHTTYTTIVRPSHLLLYAGQEGEITHGLWGATLFGDEVSLYQDTSAFSSGILLFRNCDAMHTLFQNIREDQIRRKSLQNVVFDQPYIVYNAFKYNVYDNKTITHFITSSNDTDDLSRETMIHHFAGGPGSIQKLPRMKTYLHAKSSRTLQSIIANTKSFIQEHLIPILQSCKEPVEGNIFMRHHTNSISDVFMAKCNNICNLSLSNQTKRVLEIGFNAGFSALLMLMSNPNLHLSCFDLGEHSYTQPCFDKLKEKFGDRIQITLGDSTLTLPNVTGTFDLIHIDGGHSTEVATSDIEQCYRLSEPGTILIMDDTNFPNLRLLWDTYIQKYGLRGQQTYVYSTPEHDIRYV